MTLSMREIRFELECETSCCSLRCLLLSKMEDEMNRLNW